MTFGNPPGYDFHMVCTQSHLPLCLWSVLGTDVKPGRSSMSLIAIVEAGLNRLLKANILNL